MAAMVLSRLHADIIKRLLMPLLDFHATEALERTCQGVRQSMRARDPRAVTAYDCFKMVHRDVSAVVHQQGLNVEATKYMHKFTCRFLHKNDRMCLLGRAFIYMRRFCISCIGDARLGYNGMTNLEAMYRWLSLEVPSNHRCLVSLLLLHLCLCSVLLCVLVCCLCAALRMGRAGRDIRIRAPPSRAPRASSWLCNPPQTHKNSHEIMHVCVLYLLLIRPAESPDVLPKVEISSSTFHQSVAGQNQLRDEKRWRYRTRANLKNHLREDAVCGSPVGGSIYRAEIYFFVFSDSCGAWECA
jgi:hypothetical protein